MAILMEKIMINLRIYRYQYLMFRQTHLIPFGAWIYAPAHIFSIFFCVETCLWIS